MNVAFPYQFDQRGRTASDSDPDHVLHLIEQLLFTNPGERVNRPDFGSGLMQLVFAPNSPELAATLQFAAEAAIQRYLGDIIGLQSLAVTSDESTLNVTLNYVIVANGLQASADISRQIG